MDKASCGVGAASVQVMTGFSESIERLSYAVAGLMDGTPEELVPANEAEMVAAGRDLATRFESLGMDVGDFELRLVRVSPSERRRRAAYHGAAHILAASVLGVEVRSVSLDDPSSPADESVELGLEPSLLLAHPPPSDEATRARLEPSAHRLAVVLLAGGAGELLADPWSSPSGSGTDIRETRRLCANFSRPGCGEYAFEAALRRAVLILRSSGSAMTGVAEAIQRGGTITGDAVDELVRQQLGSRADLIIRNFSASFFADS